MMPLASAWPIKTQKKVGRRGTGRYVGPIRVSAGGDGF